MIQFHESHGDHNPYIVDSFAKNRGTEGTTSSNSILAYNNLQSSTENILGSPKRGNKGSSSQRFDQSDLAHLGKSKKGHGVSVSIMMENAKK